MKIDLVFASLSKKGNSKMGSKAILLLGLCLAVVLLIASEVTARELAETTPSNQKTEQKNGVDDAKYGGGGYPGGGYGGYPGGGYGRHPGSGYGGGYPGGGYGGNRGGRGHGGGGYCYYGCCRRSYYGGGCRRCCSYKGEAVDADTHAAKPHS